MLELELLGQPYRKSDHRKELATKLQNRSSGSIEFKHQNVSGVLVEQGLPYIEGYKPRSNYQGILAKEVESFLDANPGFLRSWQLRQRLIQCSQDNHRTESGPNHKNRHQKSRLAESDQQAVAITKNTASGLCRN